MPEQRLYNTHIFSERHITAFLYLGIQAVLGTKFGAYFKLRSHQQKASENG